MAFSLQTLVAGMLGGDDDWRKRLVKEWPTMVGDLHTRMRFEKISHDVLVIGVYDIHWMHELYMMSPMILQAINEKLGGNFVAKIRFSVVNKTDRFRKVFDGASESYIFEKPLAERQQKILSTVKDQQLQDALSKLWQRCRS
jgi:hypothetical protein